MSAYHSPSEYLARSMGPHYCLGCGSDWPCVGSQMEAAERRAAPSPALTREALEGLRKQWPPMPAQEAIGWNAAIDAVLTMLAALGTPTKPVANDADLVAGDKAEAPLDE